MPAQIAIPLYVVIPCHLPISATTAQYQAALVHCYLPLVEAIENHPEVRVSLHLGGHLLDLLARNDEHLLLRLKKLCQSGQIEILAGLFYGGPVALLPERDVRGQIAMSQEFWESFIGVTPQGIYLPQLAWAPELPRLLEDTGILYSFIGSNQRMPGPNAAGILGRIERGGQRLYTFTLDHDLSNAFSPKQVPAFMARLTQHHAQQVAAVRPQLHGEQQPWGTGLCLPAELFGVWGHGQNAEQIGIGPLFSALVKNDLFTTELPLSHFITLPKVVSVALGACYAPMVPETFSLDPLHDWSQFPGHFTEADTLYRRALRASGRLRQAIARMEDENREMAWSDKLATAQRLIFAAQGIDSFGRAMWPGFSDPAVRDAVFARILSAEAELDAVQTPIDGAFTISDVDLDGDHIPDVFISTQALNVWLLPGRGGALRTLEYKKAKRSLLDVGIRREEPFRVQAILAPHVPQGDACPASHLGLLPRKGLAIDQDVDICERRGIRDWLLPAQTVPHALFSGHVRSLADIRRPWTIIHSGQTTVEQAQAYALGLIWDAHLSSGGSLHIEKEVQIMTETATLRLRYTLSPQGDAFPQEGVRWALEMPWRLGLTPPTVHIDDAPADGSEVAFAGATSYSVCGEDVSVKASLTGIDALWWTSRQTLVRDPDGFRQEPAGVVMVATAVIKEVTTLTVHLQLESETD
jgi:hypothetical protein